MQVEKEWRNNEVTWNYIKSTVRIPTFHQINCKFNAINYKRNSSDQILFFQVLFAFFFRVRYLSRNNVYMTWKTLL